MKKTIYFMAATITATFLMLSGCASTDNVSPSDKLWSEGQKQTLEGTKLQTKGQERVNKGEKQVRDGEAKVQQGNLLIEQSRKEYQVQSRSAGSSVNPEQILYESKQLERIADQWNDGKDAIKDGNTLISNGHSSIQKGKEEISKARGLIDSGQSKMNNSHKFDQPEPLDTPIKPVTNQTDESPFSSDEITTELPENIDDEKQEDSSSLSF